MWDLVANNRSDDYLLRRCAEQGDREAFETVYKRHRDGFYRFLLKLSACPVIAEDVSQQCWLKLLESLAGKSIYRPSKRAKFSTWLYTLGRNHYIDQYVRRHQVARCQSLDPPVAATVPGNDRALDTAAEVDQLTRQALAALACLPLEQRDAISLWAAGFSIDAIATITGAPRNTVLSRKRYGLAQLKSRFTSMGLLGQDGQQRATPASTGNSRQLKRAESA